MTNQPRAILFDLGSTLLQCVHADYPGASLAMFERANNPRGVTRETYAAWLQQVRGELDPARLGAAIEIDFAAYQRLLYEPFGMSFELPDMELAWDFWQAAERFELVPTVRETLAAIDRAGLPMGVISNTIMPAEILRRELARFDLAQHVQFIISSADYALRKPHPFLFQAAAGKLNVRAEAIWFVGDSWPYDVVGSSGAGMTPVWLNQAGKPRPDAALKCVEIRTLLELLPHAGLSA